MKTYRELWLKTRKALEISIVVNLLLIIALIFAIALPVFAKEATPEPKPTIYVVGTPEPVIKEPDPLISLGEFKTTAYCPCVKCCGIWSEEHPTRTGTDYIQKTASGTIPTAGRTVAADISVLPYGTTVIIDNAEYTVEDKGGAVNGNTIDIFFNTHEEASAWGVQYKTIYIKGDI